jgi:sec-independent protein translocase protein TatA
MPRIGGWEWVIVLVIVLLIFGVGRLSKVGRELGEGIREFRKGLTGGEDGNGENQEET